MRATTAILGAATLLCAVALGVAFMAATSGSPAAGATITPCITSGPLSGLDATQAANARTVIATAESMAGPRAAVIAVMTGYDESGLRVLGNPAVNTGGIPVQGRGSNADSIGIFQQRDSWGTVAQRLDPVQSTRLFVERLQKVKSWAEIDPWLAAQSVQISAWDGRPRSANGNSSVVGGNYKRFDPLAERLVTAVHSTATPQTCGAMTGGVPASTTPGSHGLPATYVVPATATPEEAKAVAFAIGQLDKPYVFGASGPNAYDCSGLVAAAWAEVGVDLPHYTVDQARSGTPTSAAALVPGDLVLVPGDGGTLAAPDHVGMYLGVGLVINAADPAIGIRVQSYQNFLTVGRGLSALRHIV